MLMCNLGTDLPEPADRLDTVRTCMQGKQAMAAMSGAQILAMSALGAGPAGASMLFGHNLRPERRQGVRPLLRPPFNLIISNVLGPRHPLYWNGARLDALYPLSIPVDGQGLNITCTSNDDTVSFGITGSRRAAPAAAHADDPPGRRLTCTRTRCWNLTSRSTAVGFARYEDKEQLFMETTGTPAAPRRGRGASRSSMSTEEIKARIEAMFAPVEVPAAVETGNLGVEDVRTGRRRRQRREG
nr:acyltransferase [Rhodococcus sp. JVH1]